MSLPGGQHWGSLTHSPVPCCARGWGLMQTWSAQGAGVKWGRADAGLRWDMGDAGGLEGYESFRGI